MAAFDILTWSANNRTKKLSSVTNTWDFLAVRIGSNNLQITQASSSAFDFSAKEIQNILTPTTATSAATKAYVDAVATGLVVKASVAAATITPLPTTSYSNGTNGVGATLDGAANGALPSIDGYTPVVGDRLLIKNEATAANNGIYTVTALGSGAAPFILTRATDADTCQPASKPKVTSGLHMFVENGSQAGEGWVLVTPDPLTLGTTALTFSQFSQASAVSAGNGIAITGGAVSARIDGNALQFATGVITLTLDGATLASSGAGLKIAAAGVTATELAASVAGNGLTGGAGTALAVVAADASIVVTSSGIAINNSESRSNDNASAITTRQIVFIKTNGNVDLAIATTQDNTAKLGVVKDASIAAGAAGNIIEREGTRINGFTGLTVGAPVYLSNTTAGATILSTSTFSTGSFVWLLGYALSATVLEWNPQFLLEY